MNKPALIALGAFILFALALFALVPPPAHLTNPPAPESAVLNVYEGTTPCADCPGIVTRLTLAQETPYSAEGTYELSLTYLERDVEPFVTTGLWTTERGTPTDPDATVFALDPDEPPRTQRYVRVNATTIRQLDREGNEIDSSLPYDLTLITEPPVLPEPRTVSGTQTCLPHKDQSGPQTMECALGFTSDDGNTYALDLGGLPEEEAAILSSGARVEISGTFTPMQLISSDYFMRYEAVGIISVSGVQSL